MQTFDAIWLRLARVLTFFAGLGIGAWEALVAHSSSPYAYPFALALMGNQLADAVERLFAAFVQLLNILATPGKLQPPTREESLEDAATRVEREHVERDAAVKDELKPRRHKRNGTDGDR